jgi:hypothetical protein
MDRQSPDDFLARHGEFVEPAKLEALNRQAEKFAREKANGGSHPTGSTRMIFRKRPKARPAAPPILRKLARRGAGLNILTILNSPPKPRTTISGQNPISVSSRMAERLRQRSTTTPYRQAGVSGLRRKQRPAIARETIWPPH